MRTSKYSEEKIIGFLRQAEAGMPIKEIGCKHGFNHTTVLSWSTIRRTIAEAIHQDGKIVPLKSCFHQITK